MKERILILGAGGQIGSELAPFLAEKGNEVFVSDIRLLNTSFPFEQVDVCDFNALKALFEKVRPDSVYHLAALLSATAEKDPQKAWQVNVEGLRNVLECCIQYQVKRLFWPSSIAVFGPNSPKENTPQHTVLEPTTIYGITKVVGEHLCHYYHLRFGLDVRSLRYPGLISYKALPGGGTTDYAVEIFYKAIAKQRYTCFLAPNRALPMMYMPDALEATYQLMQAPSERLSVRTSYNIHAFSFTPEQLAKEIQKHLPAFQCDYAPDFRDKIAQSWPQSIDDSIARRDWQWQPHYNFATMVKDMLTHIKEKVLSSQT